MDTKRYREDYKLHSNELIILKNNFVKINLEIMNQAKENSLVLTGFAKDLIVLCKDLIDLLENFDSFFYVAYEVRRNQYKNSFNSLKNNIKILESADNESLFLNDDTPDFMKLRF